MCTLHALPSNNLNGLSLKVSSVTMTTKQNIFILKWCAFFQVTLQNTPDTQTFQQCPKLPTVVHLL